MSDNITLPREVVKEAISAIMPFSNPRRELKQRVVEALRTALAAEQPKPERGRDWDDGVLEGRLREREYWLAQHTVPPAAAPEPTHPGYVIGSHWLETAYSRVCAGEAEAEVLRDYGLWRCANGVGPAIDAAMEKGDKT